MSEEEAPFYVQEEAFLEARKRPSWSKKGVFFNTNHIALIYRELQTICKNITSPYLTCIFQDAL